VNTLALSAVWRGCVQTMPLEVVAGQALSNLGEEMVRAANTPRDHGRSTFFFKLFRCCHSPRD